MNVTLDFDEKNLIRTLAIASIHDSYKILAVSSSRKEKKKINKKFLVVSLLLACHVVRV
jgi:hypothetical protein